jgi:molybdopterin biosynthesis enzyme MoaB
MGRGAVVVASGRASSGVYEDTTGPLLDEALVAWGFETPDPVVVPESVTSVDAGETVTVLPLDEDF